jgi:hypothetical protein
LEVGHDDGVGECILLSLEQKSEIAEVGDPGSFAAAINIALSTWVILSLVYTAVLHVWTIKYILHVISGVSNLDSRNASIAVRDSRQGYVWRQATI